MSFRSAAASQPAYNAVAARTTIARQAPTVRLFKPTEITSPFDSFNQNAPIVASAVPKKVDWPKSIRSYVARAFEHENQIEGITAEEMQVQLKKTISCFAEHGYETKIDWATYPLPQQILAEERRQAAAISGLDLTDNMHTAHVKSSNGTANYSPSPLASHASKRKSQDVDGLQASPAKANSSPQKTNLQDRITYPNAPKEKRQKRGHGATDAISKSDQADLEKRKQRFQTANTKSTPPWHSPQPVTDTEMPTGPVVGTSQSLEKRYFRLTAPPKAETVRPQEVLERTLAMLHRKWKGADKNYNYICGQFKSLRQDLTVQHIKNRFTVRVYESHARIALEMGDLGEYNQCQTQLRALYLQNIEGHPAEFLAYRILYFVYTCNKADMNDLLAELTPADKAQPAVRHALDIRSALALGNYHKFFKLYLSTPNMGPYLIDMFIERERLSALAKISKAYLWVALRFLTDELGFESDHDCLSFLETHGVQDVTEEKVDDKNGKHIRVQIKSAAALFDSLCKGAFSRVDIKGQI